MICQYYALNGSMYTGDILWAQCCETDLCNNITIPSDVISLAVHEQCSPVTTPDECLGRQYCTQFRVNFAALALTRSFYRCILAFSLQNCKYDYFFVLYIIFRVFLSSFSNILYRNMDSKNPNFSLSLVIVILNFKNRYLSLVIY